MGWETNCKAEVVFNKETYDSIYKVQSQQEEADKLRSHMRDELLIMAASDPKLLILKIVKGKSSILLKASGIRSMKYSKCMKMH